jgi:hypothetical protein
MKWLVQKMELQQTSSRIHHILESIQCNPNNIFKLKAPRQDQQNLTQIINLSIPI